MRQAFAQTMLRLMAEDDKIMVLLGDIGVYGFREPMARWPARCINVGVAECGMVGFAAGLALSGLYPVVHTIDSFATRRAYEFWRLDFGEQQLRGLLVTVGADKDYEKLGPSHWCPEGLRLMSMVAGMDVREPKDAREAEADMEFAVRSRSLAYVRLSEAK